MSQVPGLFLLVLVLVFALNAYGYGLIKCILKRFGNCEHNESDAWKFNVTIKTVSNKQYIDGLFTLDKPMDNNVQFNTSVARLTNGKYLYLFSIHESKACSAMNKYFGEFFYDLERMAQMMPGMCPIQEGSYRWHDAPLELHKIPTLASFPFGTLLFTNYFYERNDRAYACILFESVIYM